MLLAAAAVTLLICLNLLRSRTGRAWRAIRAHETVAEALGIGVAALQAARLRHFARRMTSVAGALFAYYRGFVSVEAFSLFLSIQYVAMIIIGGMGSLLGALLGAAFVTLFPYAIEAALLLLPNAQKLAGDIFRRQLRRVRRGDDRVSACSSRSVWSASGGACKIISCCGRSSTGRVAGARK